MRGYAAILIACVSITGACAPSEEGVVITVHTPDGNGFEPVGRLELFLGGDPDPAAGGRRIRQVLDGFGGEDIRPVDGALDGFTIFLQGIPSDVKIAAIAAFEDDPDEPEDYPVALGVIPIRFVAGELTSADVTLRGTNGGLDKQALRWRGDALADPPIGHSCLAWEDMGGTTDQIVRADDFDCDGTLPIACSDPLQLDRDQPDDLPEQDLDEDGELTCRTCQSPTTGGDVPCDCNDDPVVGAAQNAFEPEVCDGINNDCDPTTWYFDTPDGYRPCLAPVPIAGCEIGVLGCDERLGESDPNVCVPTTTTTMEPCGLDLGDPTCDSPDNCDIVVHDPAQMIACFIDYSVEGCTGAVDVVELIDDLDPVPFSPVPPVTCSAVVWGTDDAGWVIRLEDLTQTDARAIFDQPCDTIRVSVRNEGGPGGVHGAVVLVFDSVTGDRLGIPVSFQSLDTGLCGVPPMTCLPPQ